MESTRKYWGRANPRKSNKTPFQLPSGYISVAQFEFRQGLNELRAAKFNRVRFADENI